MRRELKAGTDRTYLRGSFFDSVRSREAGENPARPPPLSPGTPRATNHWTRRIERSHVREGARRRRIRKPGDLPDETFLGRGTGESAPSNSRGRGIFSNRPGFPSRRTGGSNDDRGPAHSPRFFLPASAPSSEPRRPRGTRS